MYLQRLADISFVKYRFDLFLPPILFPERWELSNHLRNKYSFVNYLKGNNPFI
jgi:hypothetical protein